MQSNASTSPVVIDRCQALEKRVFHFLNMMVRRYALRRPPSAVRRAPKKFSLYVKVNSARAAAPHFDRPS
jgi:hypothetical protein